MNNWNFDGNVSKTCRKTWNSLEKPGKCWKQRIQTQTWRCGFGFLIPQCVSRNLWGCSISILVPSICHLQCVLLLIGTTWLPKNPNLISSNLLPVSMPLAPAGTAEAVQWPVVSQIDLVPGRSTGERLTRLHVVKLGMRIFMEFDD